jgi:hypothetical protein
MRRFAGVILFVNVVAATLGLVVAANELSPPDTVHLRVQTISQEGG